MALVSEESTRSVITEETFGKMSSIREMKAEEIEGYFLTIRKQIKNYVCRCFNCSSDERLL